MVADIVSWPKPQVQALRDATVHDLEDHNSL